MRVLVDTTIWSLALRRRAERRDAKEIRLFKAWEELVRDGRIVLLGLIRQEILSGIADRRQFEKLRDTLAAFPDEVIFTADHVRAAEHFNGCRAAGVAGSPVDFLICAAAERLAAPIFTTDLDFLRFARHVPLQPTEPPLKPSGRPLPRPTPHVALACSGPVGGTGSRLGRMALTARLVPRCALAPAARASSPLGDYSRRDQS